MGTHAALALEGALKERDMPVIAGAFRFFIGRGQPDSEALLIEALKESGDAQMALGFITCGNSRLEASGRTWALQNRYEITETRMPGPIMRWDGVAINEHEPALEVQTASTETPFLLRTRKNIGVAQRVGWETRPRHPVLAVKI